MLNLLLNSSIPSDFLRVPDPNREALAVGGIQVQLAVLAVVAELLAAVGAIGLRGAVAKDAHLGSSRHPRMIFRSNLMRKILHRNADDPCTFDARKHEIEEKREPPKVHNTRT